jgi:hypothetical protein
MAEATLPAQCSETEKAWSCVLHASLRKLFHSLLNAKQPVLSAGKVIKAKIPVVVASRHSLDSALVEYAESITENRSRVNCE